MRHRLIFILFLIAPWVIAVAQEGDASVVTCPAADKLVQDPKTLKWSADQGHWRGYSLSFARDITRFLGAQWNGASLGTIYCLYRGDKMTFVVKLQFDTLVSAPSGGQWSKDLGHFKNCVSSNSQPDDCAFVVPAEQEPKTLYEELDSLQKDN